MKRRKFILLSSVSVAAAIVPWLNSCTSSTWITVLSLPSLLGQFCNENELLDIGKSYIKHVPKEAKISIIEETLLSTRDGTFEPLSEKSLQDFIYRKYELDFSQDKTLVINGWVLSQTEARQCGLFFLIHTTA